MNFKWANEKQTIARMEESTNNRLRASNRRVFQLNKRGREFEFRAIRYRKPKLKLNNIYVIMGYVKDSNDIFYDIECGGKVKLLAYSYPVYGGIGSLPMEKDICWRWIHKNFRENFDSR